MPCTRCATLEQAKEWYEAALFKLCASGVVDRSVYCAMYDMDDRLIDQVLINNRH